VKWNQAWERASNPRPIVIIGAGGIVRSAHIPAYRKLEYPIAGVYDIRSDAALDTASAFGIGVSFSSIDKAVSLPGTVFDIAVPGNQILSVLERLPDGAATLIQKPMGENLAEARKILGLCRAKKLKAAINFQLRFSPNMLALRDMLARKALGTVTDIEVRLVDRQPWQLWPFLKGAPRLEVVYHSIHYLDAIRFLFGEPQGVLCKAIAHPEMPELRDTRSSIILDYGNRIRCSLMLNHAHRHNEKHQASEFKVEGTTGAAFLTMGVNLDYPAGKPDTLEVALGASDWEALPLRGSWFIEAFEGPISNLQRFVSGEDDVLITSVDDAIRTMALVEACYDSSNFPTTPIPSCDAL
jgi:predicted dehydrogenase